MIDRLLGAVRPWHLGLAVALLLATMAAPGLSSRANAQEAGEQAGEGQAAPPEQENALVWIAKTSGFIGRRVVGPEYLLRVDGLSHVH